MIKDCQEGLGRKRCVNAFFESLEKLKKSFLSSIQYFSVTVLGKAKRLEIQPIDLVGRVLNLHGSEHWNSRKILAGAKNGLSQGSLIDRPDKHHFYSSNIFRPSIIMQSKSR